MENYILLLFSTLVAIIGYYLKMTIEELKKVNESNIDNKENIIVLRGRLDLVENNHSHLSDKLDMLNDTMKDLILEMKQLNKEIAKKKDI